MLAYQHAYHAGNFADVHKHLTLFAVIRHLLRKESAITYIDTHAGRGCYPLDAEETRKLMEYRSGILPLWQARRKLGAVDPLFGAWLEGVENVQQGEEERLTHYPGSPWWLAHALRPQDRLSLFELHPGEHRHLDVQPLPANARRIHGDGLAGMARMLPVATPRLCVLIDPSYERKEEYHEVASAVQGLVRKVRHAVALVWYPLLPAGRHREMLERMREHGLRKLWQAELQLAPPSDSYGMYGSGMLVLNPPWGLEEELAMAMTKIVPLLGASARYRSGWWVEE
ncbi:ribosomal RNA large subunit methyltransferase J [Litchfieldella qijiaojingensis]|uniref:Ribosomal RNA large subunit methyltransferase J n=1 Tax=Litchfieldella qijiaojingensis TaxID=980347 RepID=A0ABQ2YJ19_9GAMM|nr:23S rRNA (adenine(2030)-N(6))-methyltransferase RlmJ [Halomonas qijiaojingensis]GGX83714.1 ribosomal RNA large subunit methyltransferase J [Halomonas qijiaojingensis]